LASACFLGGAALAALVTGQAAGIREGSRCWHNSITSRAMATWGWACTAPCSMMLTMAYFGSITGEMQSFIERFLFPYLTYTDPPASIFPGKVRAGFIYTFGADETLVKQRGFDSRVTITDSFLGCLLGHSESICSYDTYQFEDYSKVFAPRFDPEKKAQRRKEVFPEDCNRAFEMGKSLTSDSVKSM